MLSGLRGLVAISAKCRSRLAGSSLFKSFTLFCALMAGLITNAGGIDFDFEVLRTSKGFETSLLLELVDGAEKIKKYEAMVEIAKNLDDPSDVEDLLENFKENKKPIDYRRTGVITIFVGLGLFLFGLTNIAILKGVGLLVVCIGFGSLIAGYIYPNKSHEIAEAVEKFEKK